MIFLVAMLESLVIIGIAVPGASFMIAVGVLVSFGKIPLLSAILWAIAGAIAGDAISYWIGHHYKDRLRSMWPFSRFQKLLLKGEEFFARHGGKSIVFGRFVGPVRAIIPTIAGMLGMKPRLFYFVNILSAIAWAPIYILPGLVVGAASEISLRLALMLLLILLLFFVTRWAASKVFTFFQNHTTQITLKILDWSSRHPFFGRYTRALLTPDTPAYRSLLVTASVFLLSLTLFFVVASFGIMQTDQSGINLALYNALQSLRSPAGDTLVVWLTMLASEWVYLPALLAALGWLLYKRHMTAVTHLLFVVLLGGASIQVLKYLVAAPRPDTLLHNLDSSYSFPSGHVTISLVAYGFIAVLIANGLNPRARRYPYLLVTILVIAIAFSRLYLGAHWLSDVIGALALGLILLSLTGISFQRHNKQRLDAAPLTALLLSVFTLSVLLNSYLNLDRTLTAYAPKYRTTTLPLASWWQQRWATLPAFRYDIRHLKNQPLTIQFAGDIETLRSYLQRHGWKKPASLGVTGMLQWFHTSPTLDMLPVSPQVHRGRHESLLLTRHYDWKRWWRRLTALPRIGDPSQRQAQAFSLLADLFTHQQWVIRLWPADAMLTPGNTPLYIGNVSVQFMRRPFGIVSFPVTGTDFDRPLQRLRQDISTLRYTPRRRTRIAPKANLHWNQTLLLIRFP